MYFYGYYASYDINVLKEKIYVMSLSVSLMRRHGSTSGSQHWPEQVCKEDQHLPIQQVFLHDTDVFVRKAKWSTNWLSAAAGVARSRLP